MRKGWQRSSVDRWKEQERPHEEEMVANIAASILNSFEWGVKNEDFDSSVFEHNSWNSLRQAPTIKTIGTMPITQLAFPQVGYGTTIVL